MDLTAIVVASISGAVSLTAAGISVVNARAVARLDSELEERRHARTKEEEAEALRARYRDPLLSAAFDLQSRLYNIVAQNFLVVYGRDGDAYSRSYAIDNTLYVFAEYLAWVEIIRREIRFLDVGQDAANDRWVRVLEHVRDTLARDDVDPVLRLFRGEQRGIGELMTVPLQNGDDSRRHDCLGYASFVGRRTDPAVARWFAKLEADLSLLASEPRAHVERAILLQNALVDVLDCLDPDCERFVAARRVRLTEAHVGASR